MKPLHTPVFSISVRLRITENQFLRALIYINNQDLH